MILHIIKINVHRNTKISELGQEKVDRPMYQSLIKARLFSNSFSYSVLNVIIMTLSV